MASITTPVPTLEPSAHPRTALTKAVGDNPAHDVLRQTSIFWGNRQSSDPADPLA
jgi:hypothetical protein